MKVNRFRHPDLGPFSFTLFGRSYSGFHLFSGSSCRMRGVTVAMGYPDPTAKRSAGGISAISA